MSYTKEIRQLFVANYTQPYPVMFKGVGLIDLSTGQQITDLPYNDLWIEVFTNGGPTIYNTIGTVATRQKNKPFTFVVTIYYPRTTGTSGTQYNRDDADAIIEDLDTFMLTDGFAIDSQTMIYSDQSQPQQTFTPDPDPEDNFERVTVEYLYTYNYY